MEYFREREDADYLILKNNNYKSMFLDEGCKGKAGYISYGQFIIHAVWAGYHGKVKEIGQVNEEKLLNIIEKLKESCESNETDFDFKDCEIMDIFYCFDSHKNFDGIVLKDKTHGCYPLYINKDSRFKGLGNHLVHIQKNWNTIFKLIMENDKEWNEDLEQKLSPYYFN